MFDNLKNDLELYNDFTIGWIRNQVGFGQFYFYTQDNKLYCSNEGMRREFIKQVLCELVDQCILTDDQDDNIR